MQLSEQWIHSSVKFNQLLQSVGCAHAHWSVRIVQCFDEGGLELGKERLQHGAHLWSEETHPESGQNAANLQDFDNETLLASSYSPFREFKERCLFWSWSKTKTKYDTKKRTDIDTKATRTQLIRKAYVTVNSQSNTMSKPCPITDPMSAKRRLSHSRWTGLQGYELGAQWCSPQKAWGPQRSWDWWPLPGPWQLAPLTPECRSEYLLWILVGLVRYPGNRNTGISKTLGLLHCLQSAFFSHVFVKCLFFSFA